MDDRQHLISIEAEQAVLGGLLIDNDAWIRVCDIVSEEDFGRFDHRAIWRAIRRRSEAGDAFDMLTIAEEFEASDEAVDVGGAKYIATLSGNTPGTANIETYARIVRDKSLLRQITDVSHKAQVEACQAGAVATEVINEAQAAMTRLSTQKTGGGTQPVREIVKLVFESMDRLAEGDDETQPTGFLDIDSMLNGGLRPGELVIIGGRPSMGKSTFARLITQHALQQGKRCVTFSIEDSKESLAKRAIASESRVPLNKLYRPRNMLEQEWQRTSSSMTAITKLDWHIYDGPAGVEQVRAYTRRLHIDKRVDLIVVDYLQLMSLPNGDTKDSAIGEVTRALKLFAKEIQAPVILLTQLNRSCERRPNKRPVLSDMRDSGSIEQDADVVMFLYRDEYYNPQTKDKGLAEVILSKQRNGPTGPVFVRCELEKGLMQNYARQDGIAAA